MDISDVMPHPDAASPTRLKDSHSYLRQVNSQEWHIVTNLKKNRYIWVTLNLFVMNKFFYLLLTLCFSIGLSAQAGDALTGLTKAKPGELGERLMLTPDSASVFDLLQASEFFPVAFVFWLRFWIGLPVWTVTHWVLDVLVDRCIEVLSCHFCV